LRCCLRAGFRTTHHLLRANQIAGALLIPLSTFSAAGLISAVGHDRLLHVGSMATFQAGAPINLFTSDVMIALVVVGGGCIVLPAALLGFSFHRAVR